MFGRGRATSSRRPRARAVWWALGTGVVLCLVIVGGVFLPILGLVGAADAGTAGALDVPVGSIAGAAVIGFLLALAFLALILVTRNGALAWILAVAAIVSTLLVSVWPLPAVAFAGVDQVQDVIPFIQDLISKYWPGS